MKNIEFLDTELYNKFHSNFIKNIEKMPSDIPIFLSGGIDSSTILFAMSELGRKPLCISFNHGELSQDNMVAKTMTDYFGLEFDIVDIPQTYDSFLDRTKFILKNIKKTKKFKTTTQVGMPVIEMAKHAISKGYQYASCGWTAGDLTGSGKNASMANRRGELTSYLKKNYDGEYSEKIVQDEILTPIFDFQMYDPYREENLKWIMDLDWDTIHKPYQKSVICGYYQDTWRNFKLRSNKSLQVNGGTREIMDELFLNCPILNVDNHKAIIGVLNKLYREVNKK